MADPNSVNPTQSVVDSYAFQTDQTYTETYGNSSRIFAIVIADENGEDKSIIPYTPQSWFDLRRMQRQQLSIFGSIVIGRMFARGYRNETQAPNSDNNAAG